MAPITGPKSLEDKKKFASVANHNTTRPVRSLVTIPAELSILAQLVQALRYNPEGRGFDSRWCHWDFSLT